MFSSELARTRAEIIGSILTEGLKAGSLLQKEGKSPLSSSDAVLRPNICGVYIDDFTGTIEFQPHLLVPRIQHYLYPGGDRIIPVLLERPNDPRFPIDRHYNLREEERLLFERRACASLLIVCIPTSGWLPSSQLQHIPPESFNHLLVPTAIWEEYQANSPINVGSGIRLHVVNNSVTRPIDVLHPDLTIPDYESVLVDIAVEAKKRIFIHAARLPTLEEITS